MKLLNILKGIDYELVQGTTNIDIKDIAYNSNDIKENYAFVCLIGIDTDGHNYISNAIQNGASAIIICKDTDVKEDITVIKIKDTRQELSILSANLFGNPQDKLIKIGITGTKGKTSTSWMLKSILESNNEKVGIIGTNGTYINNVLYPHKNTTPESYQIQKFMRLMVDNNVKYLIMETSSTALKVGRINNIIFDYGALTNISLDHVGPREHPTYEDYVNSKKKLFNQCKIGIVNADDKEYQSIKDASTCKLYSYGINGDIKIKNITPIKDKAFLGTKFTLSGIYNGNYLVNAPGEFSTYNATIAIILAKLLNISDDIINQGLKNFKVEGRLEIINIKDFTVIIDYAHNKISMECILSMMKNYPHNRLIAIYGCGGGRSYERRYELGVIGAKYADLNIITTDNPRNDDVKDIINSIQKAIIDNNGNYKVIEDRKEAIIYALDNALKDDIILLLGKGHEKYQEIKGVRYPFDEKEIINTWKEELT